MYDCTYDESGSGNRFVLEVIVPNDLPGDSEQLRAELVGLRQCESLPTTTLRLNDAPI